MSSRRDALPPEIGDACLVRGCHENYRPILVEISSDGLKGLVRTPGTGGEYWRPMRDLVKAPPVRRQKRGGWGDPANE